RGGAEGARRPERRRLAARRHPRTRHPDPEPAGAYRPPPRLRPAAQRGEDRFVRGADGPVGLPAIRSPRTHRTAAYAAAAQDRDGRLFRKGRTMASRGLLMTAFRNMRISPTPAAEGRGESTRA